MLEWYYSTLYYIYYISFFVETHRFVCLTFFEIVSFQWPRHCNCIQVNLYLQIPKILFPSLKPCQLQTYFLWRVQILSSGLDISETSWNISWNIDRTTPQILLAKYISLQLMIHFFLWCAYNNLQKQLQFRIAEIISKFNPLVPRPASPTEKNSEDLSRYLQIPDEELNAVEEETGANCMFFKFQVCFSSFRCVFFVLLPSLKTNMEPENIPYPKRKVIF